MRQAHPCVNPRHLFLGTIQDNNADAAAKKRHARGERSGAAKINDGCATEIRRLRRAGWPVAPIARKFGISEALVSLVARGKIWKHVDEAPIPKAIGSSRAGTKLVESDVVEIRRLRAAGHSQKVVAAMFGVSFQLISNIERGLIWNHVPQ